MRVQPIVEGPGDESAVPVLIRRVLSEHIGCMTSCVLHPYRVDRGRMVQEHRCREYLGISQLDPQVDYVLQLLDADDDCCKEVSSKILKWSTRFVYRTRFDLICIEKEFECWLLAGLESLRGVRRIDMTAAAPPNPSLIRGAKARLSELMPSNLPYSETADQAALVARVSIQAVAAACPSFQRMLVKLASAHDALCSDCKNNQVE